MYHIKTDKRSQTSAKLIGDAFLKLLKKKDFHNITITDIQQTSLVGRATFYRLFDNTTDVLQYLCDSLIDEILQTYVSSTLHTPEKFFLYFIERWMEHEQLITALYTSNHLDILYKTFRCKSDIIVRYVFPILPDDEKQNNYIMHILATSVVGGLYAWIEHKKKENPKEVFTYVKNTFSYLNKAFDI